MWSLIMAPKKLLSASVCRISYFFHENSLSTLAVISINNIGTHPYFNYTFSIIEGLMMPDPNPPSRDPNNNPPLKKPPNKTPIPNKPKKIRPYTSIP
jgi:hypothetical protein